jgi:hypothetical protein
MNQEDVLKLYVGQKILYTVDNSIYTVAREIPLIGAGKLRGTKQITYTKDNITYTRFVDDFEKFIALPT